MSKEDLQKLKDEMEENLNNSKVVYLDEYRLRKKKYGNRKKK